MGREAHQHIQKGGVKSEGNLEGRSCRTIAEMCKRLENKKGKKLEKRQEKKEEVERMWGKK
jgi:hypothetical protein